MQIRDKLQMLLAMAAADGGLAVEELHFLGDRAKEWGMSAEAFQSMLADAAESPPTLKMPKEKSEAMELMTDLIRMIGADGVLHEDEKRLFALLAAKLKMSETDVNQIIDRATKG